MGSREVAWECVVLSAVSTAWQGHCLQIAEGSCAPTAPARVPHRGLSERQTDRVNPSPGEGASQGANSSQRPCLGQQ